MASKLRELCGELEDMSVFKDTVGILDVRSRLEPAVDESESEYAALRSRLESLQSQMDAILCGGPRVEIDRLRARVTSLEEELRVSALRVAELGAEVVSLLGVAQRFQPVGSPPGSNESLVRWILESLDSRATRAESRVAELEQRICYLKGEIGAHRDSWQAAEDRAARLEAALREMEEDRRQAFKEAFYRGQTLQCPHGTVLIAGDWADEFEDWLARLNAAREALAAPSDSKEEKP